MNVCQDVLNMCCNIAQLTLLSMQVFKENVLPVSQTELKRHNTAWWFPTNVVSSAPIQSI